MKIKKNKSEIYELDGVYGDEIKFTSNDLRLKHMLTFVQDMDYEPQRVLDIGCGIGFFSNKIKTIYPKSEIYGLDISKKALSIAQKNYF